MYDYLPPASLGMRDVIAAWLVCLAVAAAVFVYPGFPRTRSSNRRCDCRLDRLADRIVRDPRQANRGAARLIEYFFRRRE